MLERNEKNRVSQPRSKKYEEEPNGNFRAEKYDDHHPRNTNKQTPQLMASTAEWRG